MIIPHKRSNMRSIKDRYRVTAFSSRFAGFELSLCTGSAIVEPEAGQSVPPECQWRQLSPDYIPVFQPYPLSFSPVAPYPLLNMFFEWPSAAAFNHSNCSARASLTWSLGSTSTRTYRPMTSFQQTTPWVKTNCTLLKYQEETIRT